MTKKYKTNYIVSEDFFLNNNKKKKQKTFHSSSLPLPPLPISKNKNITSSKPNQKVLAPGVTALARYTRFKKKHNNIIKNQQETDKIISQPLTKLNFYARFPKDTQPYVKQLLEFISKNIPKEALSWNKNDLELKVDGEEIPYSNLIDIIKYLYGIGIMWETQYTKEELDVTDNEITNIRLVPRGAYDFYSVLEDFSPTESVANLFGFYVPYVRNLVRFYFTLIENNTEKLQEEENKIKHQYDRQKHFANEEQDLLPATEFPTNNVTNESFHHDRDLHSTRHSFSPSQEDDDLFRDVNLTGASATIEDQIEEEEEEGGDDIFKTPERKATPMPKRPSPMRRAIDRFLRPASKLVTRFSPTSGKDKTIGKSLRPPKSPPKQEKKS